MEMAQENAIKMIEQQQKGIENSAAWYAGEQLKDICRNEPDSAELIAHDLSVPEMSIVNAERKIKAYADKQTRVGNCVFVPPPVAEGILREFYGLKAASVQGVQNMQPAASGISLDLTSFL